MNVLQSKYVKWDPLSVHVLSLFTVVNKNWFLFITDVTGCFFRPFRPNETLFLICNYLIVLSVSKTR